MGKKLKVVTTFSGIGFPERGLELAGYDVDVVGTCETDVEAIVAYAAIHNGLTYEMIANYEDYPSREEMVKWLEEHNIGYDFDHNKPYNWQKKLNSKKMDIERCWLACKLNNNFGDICKVDEFPECDLFTYSSPCFVEGTLVMTEDGYKEIQNLTTDDLVLTHNNKWQRVLTTMTNETSQITKVKCMGSELIHCTPNHPFYVRTRYHEWNNELRRYNRLFTEPEWVEAKDLTKEHFIGTAINPTEEIPEWDGIEKKIGWGHIVHENKLSDFMDNKDFWYLMGRYIGDGWVRPQSGIIICANDEKIGKLQETVDNLGFGYNTVRERTVNKLHIPFQEIGIFCQQFGKGAGNKHLTKSVMNLPIDLLKEFLMGYFDSDGCYTNNAYKVTSVSRNLIYEVGACIVKAYHRPISIGYTRRPNTTVIEGRTVNQKDTYYLTFRMDSKAQDEAFYEDGYIWMPIRTVETVDDNSLVYNIEVENDNSYMIQNVIVHNCQSYSIAGRQDGNKITCNDCGFEFNPFDYDVKDRYECPHCHSVNIISTRSGLIAEVERIILQMVRSGKAPEILLQENVDALVSKKFMPDFQNWIERLDRLGYNTYWQCINTKHCSYPEVPTPQNRNRVFSISIRKDIDNGKFEFPKKFDAGIRLKDILQDNVDEKYYIQNDKAQKLIDNLVLNGVITKDDLNEN